MTSLFTNLKISLVELEDRITSASWCTKKNKLKLFIEYDYRVLCCFYFNLHFLSLSHTQGNRFKSIYTVSILTPSIDQTHVDAQ